MDESAKDRLALKAIASEQRRREHRRKALEPFAEQGQQWAQIQEVWDEFGELSPAEHYYGALRAGFRKEAEIIKQQCVEIGIWEK